MIETASTKEARAYAEKYYGDRKDECGKPIIERLLWVAERMEDEMSACAALLQDFMHERLREWPSLSMGIPSPVFHAMETLFYYEDREPYDSYIRHVLTDEVAAKVKIVDLQYRSNPANYAELTTELIDRILMYRSAYWQMFLHKIGHEEENLQYDEMNVVKTSCCQRIVPRGTRFCPDCGKKIDNNTAEQLRYGFDKFSTGMECWCCGVWVPASYRHCGRCGEDLYHPRKTGSTIWEDQKMRSDLEQLFYKNMIAYLVDHRAFMDYLDSSKSENDSCRDPHEIPYCINGRSFEEVMGEIIETLEASPYMDKDHFRQYTRVRILSLIKGNPTTQEIFRFLFDLCNDEVMSWPAYDILFDRFGDIMTAALRIASPCDLNDNAQAERLRAIVYLFLSEYIPSDLQEDQLLIYGDGIEKNEDSSEVAVFSEDDDKNGVPLGHVNEDYFLLECCVTQVEKADFENSLDVDYIVAYADEGLHGENTLIENMITYVNRDDPRQAVTYQIIGKTYYDSAKEMIADLGAKAFGYTAHEASSVADLIDNAGEYDHGKGAQALWIKRLDFPVAGKLDIKRFQSE